MTGISLLDIALSCNTAEQFNQTLSRQRIIFLVWSVVTFNPNLPKFCCLFVANHLW